MNIFKKTYIYFLGNNTENFCFTYLVAIWVNVTWSQGKVEFLWRSQFFHKPLSFSNNFLSSVSMLRSRKITYLIYVLLPERVAQVLARHNLSKMEMCSTPVWTSLPTRWPLRLEWSMPCILGILVRYYSLFSEHPSLVWNHKVFLWSSVSVKLNSWWWNSSLEGRKAK